MLGGALAVGAVSTIGAAGYLTSSHFREAAAPALTEQQKQEQDENRFWAAEVLIAAGLVGGGLAAANRYGLIPSGPA